MEQPMHQTQMTMPQHHQQTTAIHPNMHMSAAAAAAAGLPPSGAATGPAGAAHQSGGHPTHHPFLSSPALASPVGSTNNATHPNNPPLAANAPCSTLFVANLGQFVSEHELKEVFSSMPGFCRLRMHTKGTHNITSSSTTSITSSTTTITSTNVTNNSNTSTYTPTCCSTNSPNTLAAAHGAGAAAGHLNSLQQQQYYNNYNNATGNVGTLSGGNLTATNANHPVAFIEFKDANTAAAAMQQLQGKYLLSSDRGSIRIEFAKTKMINDGTITQMFNGNHGNNHNVNCNSSSNNSTHNPNKLLNTTRSLNPTTMAMLTPPPNNNCSQLVILNGYPTANGPAMSPSIHGHRQIIMAPPPPHHLQHTQFINCAAAAASSNALSAMSPSLSTIQFNSNATNCNNNGTNNTNNNTTTTILNNNNNNFNNANLINNNNNRSTALPQPPPPLPPQPTNVVVNSLQHQLHPIQHQNHLFRDRSGYGIKA